MRKVCFTLGFGFGLSCHGIPNIGRIRTWPKASYVAVPLLAVREPRYWCPEGACRWPPGILCLSLGVGHLGVIQVNGRDAGKIYKLCEQYLHPSQLRSRSVETGSR